MKPITSLLSGLLLGSAFLGSTLAQIHLLACDTVESEGSVVIDLNLVNEEQCNDLEVEPSVGSARPRVWLVVL